MNSKEALEELEVVLKSNIGTKRYADIFENHLLKPIKRDLDKLDKVWDKVEELLQDELTSLVREIPYDMLNSVKVRVLSKLKDWLENE